MNPFRESICLAEPLREARLAGESRSAAASQEQLAARYEQGLRDGEKALREQLLQQRADVLELQKGVLQALKQTLPQVRAECEAVLVALALEVAQKLVAGLPVEPAMVEAAVREALGHVEETHQVTVLLNAEDFALLQRVNSPGLLTTLGGEPVRFEVSSEVTRGGCLAQTHFGVVDARRETKFELLKKALQT